ncbi:TetR/AcrR family transcriptional regulator [Nocardioides guangzhouensis]|uniref:TetR/AcrR family transcriptional regulator n=1 Tax=Nocardioides guangzhouensis TaxID=2497878 RepID=UPI0014382E58|nr:TetR/AcrR family transcriptional regulator [Nocardioides guangzhouensis]
MPRDGRPTRERILISAEALVIENGYAATSVDQVIAASGTSKGAFFHHFGSKLDLARALVERYAAGDVAQLDAATAYAEAVTDEPLGQVDAFLAWFEERADDLMDEQSSCLYISVLTERQLVNAGTAEPIVKAVVAWRDGLARLLAAALADGAGGRRHQVDVDALADHVFVTFEGAFLLARATGDPGHMRRQLHVLRDLVRALLRAR